MIGNVRKWTDVKLANMEKKIAKIYSQSEKEMRKKWDAYMKRGEKRISALKNAYTEALNSGDKESIAEAKKKLEKATNAFTLQNEHFKKMVDSVTLDMAQVNEKALSYIYGELPEIYAMNYADINEVIKHLDVDFTLPNKDAIKRMVIDGDIKTPFMRTTNFMNIPKDQRWNTKFINSEVLQGIIQGEDIRKISNRIFPEIMSKTTYEGLTQKDIIKRNRQAAVRNARTLVTGAENRGKFDSYKALDKKGLVLKKVWIATGDSRTRDWHLSMDGQEVDLDEEFEDGNGDFLRFPADPQAKARTVYNCRCAMVTNVVGFRNADGSIRKIEEIDEGKDLHDKQIAEEVQKRREAAIKKKEKKEAKEKEKTEKKKPKPKKAKVSTNIDDYNKWNSLKQREEYTKMIIDKDVEKEIYGGYGYIQTGNSFKINKAMRYDKVDELDDHNKEIIRMMKETIQNNTLSENVRLVRMLDEDYLENMFGLDYDMIENLLFSYEDYEDVLQEFVGTTIKEKGFMSASTDIEKNVFTDRPVSLEILAPQGTNAYVTKNFGESEVVFNAGSEYEILKFRKEEGKWGETKIIITILMK